MNTNYHDLSPLLEEHEQDVSEIAMALMPFHDAREATYQRSFAKRGEVGVWMNLGRKIDRVDGVAESLFQDGQNGVTLVDTLVDQAMYALKWLAVIRRVRPADLEAWVRQIYCRDVDMSPEAALFIFGLVDTLPDCDVDVMVGVDLARSDDHDAFVMAIRSEEEFVAAPVTEDMPIGEALARIKEIAEKRAVSDTLFQPGSAGSGATAGEDTEHEEGINDWVAAQEDARQKYPSELYG